jgi:hypothetical protein
MNGKFVRAKSVFVMQPLQNPPLCSRTVVIGVAVIGAVATFSHSLLSAAMHSVGILYCIYIFI